jgi:tetratricopeptide (TPR) repeat protein
VLYQDDQFDKALEENKKAVAIDDSKFIAWQQIMFLYDRTRNYDSLLAVSDRAVELFRIRTWPTTLMVMQTCS